MYFYEKSWKFGLYLVLNLVKIKGVFATHFLARDTFQKKQHWLGKLVLHMGNTHCNVCEIF